MGLEVASVEDSVQNRDGRSASDPPANRKARLSRKFDDYLPRRGPQRPRGAEWPLPGVESRLKELGFEWNVDFNNIEGAVRGARAPAPPRALHPPRPHARRLLAPPRAHGPLLITFLT